MIYEIVIGAPAVEELELVRSFEKKKIVSAIEKQLTHNAATISKNRKCLASETPAFEFEPPIWELRVGDYRVFYDIDETSAKVHVRAVRRKQPNKRTKDIFQ